MLIDVLIFIAVLGVLIFFHELGHFLAAKACGIYVDRFSLGMPPRVFGVRLGETDYCVGALPIGGYVKMAGQEDAPMTDEERDETYGHVPEDRWFNKKPVWQRFIVIFAGPAMNFVLAILLYGIIAAVGAEVPEADLTNKIGMVEPDSPAATAPMYVVSRDRSHVELNRPPDATGWRTGDRILSIDGESIDTIQDVLISAVLGADKALLVEIERDQADGRSSRYLSPVRPAVRADDDLPSFGISAFDPVLIAKVMEGSPAEAAGLQPNDIITRADGRIVEQTVFRKLVEQTPDGDSILLEIRRGDDLLEISVQPETVGRCMGLLAAVQRPGLGEVTENGPLVVRTAPEALREARDLLAGDIIEKIEGKPATLAALAEHERIRPGKQLEVQIRRPQVIFGLLRKEEVKTVSLPIESVRAIGIAFGQKTVFHRVPPAQVVPEAFRLGYQALARTVRTVKALVTRSVSAKNIGGPVFIFQITTSAARAGVWYLFNITAFVSVNLCVINLLPLPVLDGGLLIVLSIEGVRRKQMNVRVLERIQQVGLILIISLLLFVTYNDITRWVMSKLP